MSLGKARREAVEFVKDQLDPFSDLHTDGEFEELLGVAFDAGREHAAGIADEVHDLVIDRDKGAPAARRIARRIAALIREEEE